MNLNNTRRKDNFIRDIYLKIKWKNEEEYRHRYTEGDISTPIMLGDKVIGFIDDVNENEVTGLLFWKKSIFSKNFNERKQLVSVEASLERIKELINEEEGYCGI